MDEIKLKNTLQEYHLFKGVFDSLFKRLLANWDRLELNWIRNEITILSRLFAESKKCLECIDIETTLEQKRLVNLGTLKKKWESQFRQPWEKFLEKWRPKLFR